MRKFFRKIRNYFKRLRATEIKMRLLEERMKVVEDFMQTARNLQVEKNMKVAQKKKWLGGYPDETKSDKKKGTV